MASLPNRNAADPYKVTATPHGKDAAAVFAAACRRQELATQYGPLAVMRFDGIEPVGPGNWKDTPSRVAAMLHSTQPAIMIGNHGGAPEDFVGVELMVGRRDGPYRDGGWGGATCEGRSIYLLASDRVGTELELVPPAAKIRSARSLHGGRVEFRADARGLHLPLPDRAQGQRPVFARVKVELARAALEVPAAGAQPNLAASARAAPSSIRDSDPSRWGPALLFDSRGGSVSFSRRTGRLGGVPVELAELRVFAPLPGAAR